MPAARVKHFSELHGAVRVLWAKSDESSGHGLLAHMLDVAAVALTLLEAEPVTTLRWAAKHLGLQEHAAARWVAALIGLHDFGKATPGFQAKWPEGCQADVQAGLAFSHEALKVSDHAGATAALLGPALLRHSGAEIAWVRHVLQAISAHHGYHYSSDQIKEAKPRREGSAWEDARQQLFDAYWSVLSPSGVPAHAELSTPMVEWLAGLTSVADWIGSNVQWFPMGERSDLLEQHFLAARQLAEQALAAIGWRPYRALLQDELGTDAAVKRIVKREDVHQARPLQLAGDALLRGSEGPALMLVEAPMGEGKTELAFLAHLRLQRSNAHRGLYIALPTQATGNAMFERTIQFLHAFDAGQSLDIQLAHGGALLNETVAHLHSVFGDPGESVSASAWFSQRRRPLLSPYGVGTVDQALFSVLNVKHHFVRLWGLSNRVVVLDEVHAYDTYTSGLILALLRWLKAQGSSVILMSATLPQKRMHDMLAAWGVGKTDIATLAYPRVLLADQRGISGSSFAARTMPPITLCALGESLDDIEAQALALLAPGGCGAVIVNTVDRAQALFLRLAARLKGGVELLLFHAQFPADDRSQIEHKVLDNFGLKGPRPACALLIATQVAEQSLDIDFDFMLSDLAPIDLLLQRAGRLHRHQRNRPDAHQLARLHVAGLQPEQLPDLKGTAWKYMYDPYILGRTWALLSRESVLQLPQDIDRMVQAVYGDEALPESIDGQILSYIEERSYGESLARVNKEYQQSVNVSIHPDAEPQSVFLGKPNGHEKREDPGLRNRTRLGEDAVGLVPVLVTEAGWCVDPSGPAFDPAVILSDALARQLCARQISLSRKAAVTHFEVQPAPEAFKTHPLLKHLRPLPLSDDCYLGLKSRVIRLDPVLGLVYEHAESKHEHTDSKTVQSAG